MLQKRGNVDARLIGIESGRTDQMALLLVEANLAAELLADLLEHFLIIEARNMQCFALLIEVRADAAQKFQLQSQAIFDAGLEDFEHAVAKGIIGGRIGLNERNDHGHAGFSDRGGSKPNAEPIERAEFARRISAMVASGTEGVSDSSSRRCSRSSGAKRWSRARTCPSLCNTGQQCASNVSRCEMLADKGSAACCAKISA